MVSNYLLNLLEISLSNLYLQEVTNAGILLFSGLIGLMNENEDSQMIIAKTLPIIFDIIKGMYCIEKTKKIALMIFSDIFLRKPVLSITFYNDMMSVIYDCMVKCSNLDMNTEDETELLAALDLKGELFESLTVFVNWTESNPGYLDDSALNEVVNFVYGTKSTIAYYKDVI